MTRRDHIIQWLSYTIALLLVLGLERLVLSRFTVWDVIPVLLPIALAACSTLEGPKFGAAFGILVGILMSVSAGGGFWRIVICSAAGLLCGLITRYGLPQSFTGHLACSTLVMFLRMIWCVGTRLINGTANFSLLLRIGFPEFLWSLVFTFPIYLLFLFVCRHWGRIYFE